MRLRVEDPLVRGMTSSGEEEEKVLEGLGQKEALHHVVLGRRVNGDL